MELARPTKEEKESQISRLHDVQQRHPGVRDVALANLRNVALSGGNIFAELMNTVRHATLGEITHAHFEVGGSYRRNI